MSRLTCSKEVCLEVAKHYQVKFLEIGTDKDHVHFLVQSVSTYSVSKLVTLIKSISAREIFKRCPKLRRSSGVEKFWTDDYFASTLASMKMSK
jgi:REP element-mobilizing transposase RayT